MSIDELRSHWRVDLDFPEYQREPNVWARTNKQKLIDSILRKFDISSIYLYEDGSGLLACIDGQQRINAIMSFLGQNEDDGDNKFPLLTSDEISGEDSPFAQLNGKTFEQIELLASPPEDAQAPDEALGQLAATAKNAIEQYRITTVKLSDAETEEEFNLQFLRLNLGAIVNSGEKLNAMVGAMRDLVFKQPSPLGQHPFLDSVHIPERRFAKQVTVAQILIHIFALEGPEADFARARYTDLQGFFRRFRTIDEHEQELIGRLVHTLDALAPGAAQASDFLKNRAVTVSLVLLAFDERVGNEGRSAEDFWAFTQAFLGRLDEQVQKMRLLMTNPSAPPVPPEYQLFLEFQRHLTQASVERPAVKRRHDILKDNLARWDATHSLLGDS